MNSLKKILLIVAGTAVISSLYLSQTVAQEKNNPKKPILEQTVVEQIKYPIYELTEKQRVSAEEKKSTLSISLESVLDTWIVSKKEYTHMQGKGFDVWYPPNTMEKRESDAGFLFGPEIVYSYQRFFIRGFYLQGKSNFFKREEGERRDVGFDVGIDGLDKGATILYRQKVGAFIGWRNMNASFSKQSANITDHSISDVVLGVFFRTSPDKPGFKVNIEMVLGVTGLRYAFSESGFKENTTVGEGELNFGYRLTTLPLTLSTGYRLWCFDKPAHEYKHRPYLGKTLERLENRGHGATFKVMYSF